jgi:hypothetical protein
MSVKVDEALAAFFVCGLMAIFAGAAFLWGLPQSLLVCGGVLVATVWLASMFGGL